MFPGLVLIEALLGSRAISAIVCGQLVLMLTLLSQWDKKCLVPGLGWEEGFVSAVCSCRVAVLVMSRKTFVNQPKYDVTQLTSESRGDNVILEYELVLELFDAGRIKAVLPVLVGDLKNDADMGGEVYTHFFSSGCLPALPDVKIPSIQAKALSYIRSEPGLEDELSQ